MFCKYLNKSIVNKLQTFYLSQICKIEHLQHYNIYAQIVKEKYHNYLKFYTIFNMMITCFPFCIPYPKYYDRSDLSLLLFVVL